jgi:hypothetical protein
VDGADAHDGASDGVRCTDRDAGCGRSPESNGPGTFGTETADGLEFRDPLSHGVDDAPSAEVGVGGDGGVGSEDEGPVEASPTAEHGGLDMNTAV